MPDHDHITMHYPPDIPDRSDPPDGEPDEDMCKDYAWGRCLKNNQIRRVYCAGWKEACESEKG